MGRKSSSNAGIEKRICERCENSFPSNKVQCPYCRHMNLDQPTKGIKTLAQVNREAPPPKLITGPWDFCFGDPIGIASDQVILLGGGEGCGKSTAALEICDAIAGATKRKPFYLAAEESDRQVAARADRLKLKHQELILIYALENDENLGEVFEEHKPSAFIIDSLQGLVGTDAEAAVKLCKRMKKTSVKYQAPTIIISQLNKGDDFSGVRAILHEVDTTCQFFKIDAPPEFIDVAESQVGDLRGEPIRELTTEKNRYGGTGKSVFFAMTATGLKHIEEPEEDEEDDD